MSCGCGGHHELRKAAGKYWDKEIHQYVDFDSAYFHTWGSEYEEGDTSFGNYSVAILELPDGRVVTTTPDMMHFLNPLGE